MIMEAVGRGKRRESQRRKKREEEEDGTRMKKRTVDVSPVGLGVKSVKSVDRERKEASDGQGDRHHSIGSVGSDEHL